MSIHQLFRASNIIVHKFVRHPVELLLVIIESKALSVMLSYARFEIDNRKKEMNTKPWYSTIGYLATRWLSSFSGVARACAHVHMIFIIYSIQKSCGKLGRYVSF